MLAIWEVKYSEIEYNEEDEQPILPKSVQPSQLRDVICGCVQYDPKERYTADKLLKHEFFDVSTQENQNMFKSNLEAFRKRRKKKVISDDSG